MNSLTTTHSDLKARWDALRESQPRVRIRDAAHELNVSELQLLTTDLGRGVTRLRLDFPELLRRLGGLGSVMGLTRNESCVIEVDGSYENSDVFEHAAQVVSEGIDLRIFPSHWKFAFAVEKEGRKPSRSIQIFEADGTASHKVFLRDGSDLDAFRALVDDLRHEDQGSEVDLSAYPPPSAELPDAQVDKDALLAAWSELSDTHDFFRVLRRFGVTRTQALRLAEGRFTRRVATGAARTALLAAARDAVPIMAFVGSRGTIQIFTGPVRRTLEVDGWFNVMDPGFNLHLDQNKVASAWVVEKNGEGGVATSLEIYDAAGETIALFFGVRKPGSDGGAAWQRIASHLE